MRKMSVSAVEEDVQMYSMFTIFGLARHDLLGD